MKSSFVSCLSALAAVALASPVAPVIQTRADAVTAAQLTSFKLFAQYAGATYCNSFNTPGQKIACTDGVCPDVEANNATTLASFGSVVTDHRGFIAVDHTAKLIVVSLRGTVSVRNWITDFIMNQVPCDLTLGCFLHAGFYAAWLEVKASVFAGVKAATAANPGYKIITTGHSLGGSTATIGAAYLRKAGYAVDIYTYGSPRVGNGVFAKFVTAQPGAEFRVTHGNDPIARLPPIIFNYRHTSPEYWHIDDVPAPSNFTLCTGHTNTDCNGGTQGFSLDPHGWYFFKINGCATGQTPFKRNAEISDAQIAAQLNDWVHADIDFHGE